MTNKYSMVTKWPKYAYDLTTKCPVMKSYTAIYPLPITKKSIIGYIEQEGTFYKLGNNFLIYWLISSSHSDLERTQSQGFKYIKIN